jgi:subtilase family serine protease
MRLFRTWFLFLMVSVVSLQLVFAAVPDRIAQSIDSHHVTALAKSVHAHAQPQYDRGRVEPSLALSYITMLLSPSASQQKALERLLAQQQDPASPNYHKWLTPEQYADRFGLSPNDVQRLTTWLKSQGFTILRVGGGRNSIVFKGTAAQVESAFQTEIHRYEVNGEQHLANSSPLMIPAALSGIVSGVMGLHDFRPKPMGIRKAARMQPRFSDSNLNPPEVIAPGDIATIYHIDPLYQAGINGSGHTLAVVGQTDIYLADISDFRSGFNLPSFSCSTGASGLITSCSSPYFSYVLLGNDPGSPSLGDLNEADLDVEWSGAVARNAQIIFVNAETNNGVYDALTDAIDPGTGLSPLARVISMSYGSCEAMAPNLEAILQQGVGEGVTILNSSGDNGVAECDPNGAALATGGLALSYPASSPEVTGVGGTAIPLSHFTGTFWGTSNAPDGGSALSYVPETAWNDDAEFVPFCTANPCSFTATTAQQVQAAIGMSSTGGGVSNCFTVNASNVCTAGFPQPSWQTVTIPGQAAARFQPDISLLATPNFPGYIFCTTLGELQNPPTNDSTSSCANGISAAVDTNLSIIGGTSVSTPVFAGMVTLLNEYLGGSGLGNINPMLYQLAKSSSSKNAFHPVTSGNNLVNCEPNTPAAQPKALQCPGTGVFGYEASNADAATGYNLVTGLGSVDVDNLAKAWAQTDPPGFNLVSNVGTIEVTPGEQGNASISIVALGGFNVPALTFTCTEPASLLESLCTVSPSSPTTQNPVNLNVTTTAPVARLRSRGRQIFYAALLPGLLGIFCAGSRGRAARSVRLLGLMVVLGCSTLWLGSCSNSSGSLKSGGTSTGSYTLTISATTGGANPVNASTTITLQVN